MRTTLATIVLWSLATILLCAAALFVTAQAMNLRRDPKSHPARALMKMIAEEADDAFEAGGHNGLDAYLKRLGEKLPGQHYLLDANRHDLLDGTDRSQLLQFGEEQDFAPVRTSDGRLANVTMLHDTGHRFIWIAEPWGGPPNPLPLIAVVVFILGAMATALALYLSTPLNRLRIAMNRFSRGDLSARVHSTRPDEIGVLSREFDVMAERIETLLAAERRLLQDVSHELRSPLTRLDVAVDLALRKPDNGALLERIRRDISRVSSLVSEVLQLTRAETDPASRNMDAVSIEGLAHDVVEDSQIEAEARGCHIAVDSSWRGEISGDAELLRRAIENVLRNAIRHSPEGKAIVVSIEHRDDTVRIGIRDFGAGVPEEALTKIFEPFFRVEGDRSRETGGAGLGLSIARRAVEVHGGTISARNLNPGLLVQITLPFEEQTGARSNRT